MTDKDARLLELVDELQTALDRLRAAIGQASEPEPASKEAQARAVEAFADETFRSRDA